jgi:hypothetical protein
LALLRARNPSRNPSRFAPVALTHACLSLRRRWEGYVTITYDTRVVLSFPCNPGEEMEERAPRACAALRRTLFSQFGGKP